MSAVAPAGPQTGHLLVQGTLRGAGPGAGPATVSTRFLAGSPEFVDVDVVVATGSTTAQWSTTACRVDEGEV